MQKPEKILYTAHATSTGGRTGSSQTNDGRLKLTLSTPKSLGGDDGQGTNPEQLFAAGYSACFLGALKYVAMTEKVKLPESTHIEAQIGIGAIPQGFGIQAQLTVTAPEMDAAQLQKLVEKAHQVCPYSNATRGNIEVSLVVNT